MCEALLVHSGFTNTHTCNAVMCIWEGLQQPSKQARKHTQHKHKQPLTLLTHHCPFSYNTQCVSLLGSGCACGVTTRKPGTAAVASACAISAPESRYPPGFIGLMTPFTAGGGCAWCRTASGPVAAAARADEAATAAAAADDKRRMVIAVLCVAV